MPSWTRRLEDFSRAWTRRIALVGLLGLLAQSIVTVVDILLRAVFATPVHGLSDMYELVVIFMVAAAFPASLAGRHQITIRFLGKAVHWRLREALELFGHALMLFVFLVMGWQLVLYTATLFQTGQTTWLLGIPMGPSWSVATALILLCVPVEAGVVTVQFMRMIARTEPGPREPGGIQSDHESLAELEEYETGAI